MIDHINYNYPQPNNFDPSDPKFDIFKNLKAEDCYAPIIKNLENVRVSNNSVAYNYFKIFPESCIAEKIFQQYQSSYKFFLKFSWPQFNFSKKRFLLITDEWTSNYYHWHIFALGRLQILKEQNLIKDSLLILPQKYKKYSFVIPSLEKFGVKKEQLVFLRKKSNIKVAKLPLINSPQNHPQIFKAIRETLLKGAKPINDFGDKIYISRANMSSRFLENENEVAEILRKFGFKTLIADKFSYEEQIGIFSQAKYIVAPHGAALTNLMFLPKNSSVFELATGYHPLKPLTDFYKLATMLDLKYFYQRCEMGESTKKFTDDPHCGSLDVDLEKFEKNLKLMMENDSAN